MSLHDDVQQQMQKVINDCAGAKMLSPTALALAVYDTYTDEKGGPHVSYGCIEHFKQMARAILARKLDPRSEVSESVAYQGDMFSGLLQQHYPILPVPNDDPVYKRLELLSDGELAWNVSTLRKSAHARLEHADALEAYRKRRLAQSSA